MAGLDHPENEATGIQCPCFTHPSWARSRASVFRARRPQFCRKGFTETTVPRTPFTHYISYCLIAMAKFLTGSIFRKFGVFLWLRVPRVTVLVAGVREMVVGV